MKQGKSHAIKLHKNQYAKKTYRTSGKLRKKHPSTSKSNLIQNLWRSSVSSLALLCSSAGILATTPAQAVVPNDKYTPEDIYDKDNVWAGVGQMIIRQPDKRVGLCTGTAINPRMIIFAGHCVHSKSSEDYGSRFKKTPIGFGFQSKTRDSAISWIRSGFTSVPDKLFFNMSDIIIHPDNSEKIWWRADVAIAASDTPMINVPTYSLLFSPLSGETHASMVGYGRTGSGTTGSSQGIDFKRRVGENMVGYMGSIDRYDKEIFDLKVKGNKDPQDLYYTDFDDPKRSKDLPGGVTGYDFNPIKGKRTALERESSTAGGDSGGPLMIDQKYGKPVVAGVLSGGSRHYVGQPSSSYGGTSFYQPLFLFANWIAENNPYKYVEWKGGDGHWTDISKWRQLIDPAYKIDDGSGKLINGIPDKDAGTTGSTPDFGTLTKAPDRSYPPAGSSSSTPSSKKSSRPGLSSVAEGKTHNNRGQISVSDLLDKQNIKTADSNSPGKQATTRLSGEKSSGLRGRAEEDSDSLPSLKATRLNTVGVARGIGSTGFSPNNTDGEPGTAFENPAQYFEVWMTRPGTVTLSGGGVEIDRLQLRNPAAEVNIAPDGDMAVLIDVVSEAGTLNIDGRLSTRELTMMRGLLSGSGTLEAQSLYVVGGGLAAGGLARTGALTTQADVMLTSASTFLYDISPLSQDSIQGIRNLSLNGRLIVNFLDGVRPKDGTSYQALSYSGEATGNFSGIFLPGIFYGDTRAENGVVTLTIRRNSYVGHLSGVTGGSTGLASGQPAQGSLAETAFALDAAHSAGADKMDPLFGELDFLTSARFGNVLQVLRPWQTLLADALVRSQSENIVSRFSDLSASAFSGVRGVHFTGFSPSNRPVHVANLDSREAFFAAAQASESSGGQKSEEEKGTSSLPESPGVGASLAQKGWGFSLGGGYIFGDAGTGVSYDREDIQSFYLMASLDKVIHDRFLVGASVDFSKGDSDIPKSVGSVDAKSYGITAYGAALLGHGFKLDAYAGLGRVKEKIRRRAFVHSKLFEVDGKSDGDRSFAGASLSYTKQWKNMLIRPALSVRHIKLKMKKYQETGSAIAQHVMKRDLKTTQLEAGIFVQGAWELQSQRFRPFGKIAVVYDTDNKRDGISAVFVGDPTQTPFFVQGNSRTRVWGDMAVGIQTALGQRSHLSFSVRHTLGRGDLDFGSLNASVRVKF